MGGFHNSGDTVMSIVSLVYLSGWAFTISAYMMMFPNSRSFKHDAIIAPLIVLWPVFMVASLLSLAIEYLTKDRI